MEIQYLASQAAGIVGVICFIISFQVKSNKSLFKIQTLACFMMSVQFFLLGAMSGVLTQLLFVVRNIMLYNINEWHWVKWKGWIGILCGVSLVITIVTWTNWYDLLPFIAMVGSTIGLWTNNAQKIRLCNLVCASPAWIIYDVIVGAWAGVLNETIILSSILISIYRFGWKNMDKTEQKTEA